MAVSPDKGAMAFDIDAALRYVVEREGSDLHVKVPAPPMARIDGELRPLEGTEPLTAEDTEAALAHILKEPELLEEFATDGEVDFSYEVRGLSRFRVNAFRSVGLSRSRCGRSPSRCGWSTTSACPRSSARSPRSSAASCS